MKRLYILFVVGILIASCAPRPPRQGEPLLHLDEGEPPISPPPPEFPPIAPEGKEGLPQKPLVSLDVKGIPLEDALSVILENTDWNLIFERNVDPTLPVWTSFKDLPLNQAVDVILDPLGLSYEVRGNFVKIKAFTTRIFEIGYVLNKITSEVKLGGDVLGGTSEEESGLKGDISSVSKTPEEQVDVFEQLAQGIETLLSPEGSFVINRMAGLLIVTDRKSHVERVATYLNSLRKALSRQVLIEAKIIEVTLKDETSTGVDWSFIATRKVGEYPVTFSGTQVLGLSDAVFTIGASFNEQNLILQALEKQGQIKVLSNPRIQVANGQTALFSVGKTQSYWELTAQGGGAQVGTPAVYPEKKSVLVGILMGVTAYVHSDGKITMYITPVISDIAEWESYKWEDQELAAPNLNIREASTMIEVRDEETVVIGGLITNKTKIESKKIPILGDIPILGFLFKDQKRTTERIELVILLSPHIEKRT